MIYPVTIRTICSNIVFSIPIMPLPSDTQYRMHPAISMLPSDLFYGGKLKNGVTPPERRPLQGFDWPREEFPVAFIPVTESTETDDDGVLNGEHR